MPRLIATFRPQQWLGDECVSLMDQCVDFDATEQFLNLPLDRIRKFEENNYDSDELGYHLSEYENHDGPYEVDTDIDGWLEDCHFPPRSELTQGQLDALRSIFRVGMGDNV